MDIPVNATDIVTLLARRIADLVVEVDTYRVLVQKLSEGNEALSNRVLSLSNLMAGLEAQVEALGETPITQGIAVP